MLLAFDPLDAVLYSNRSACRVHQDEYRGALRDAEKCIKYNPDWAKGYLRLANALFGLGDYIGAEQACGRGLAIDPEHSALSKLKSASEGRNEGALGSATGNASTQRGPAPPRVPEKDAERPPGARRRRGARHLQGHRGDDVEDGHAALCGNQPRAWAWIEQRGCGNIVASMAEPPRHRADAAAWDSVVSMAWGARNLIPHRPPGVAGMAGLDMANLPSAAADQPQMTEAQMRKHARHRAGVKPPPPDGAVEVDSLRMRLRLVSSALRSGSPRLAVSAGRSSRLRLKLASVLLR